MSTFDEQKILLALDFDCTVIECNSDTFVNKLAPNGKIPNHIKELYRKSGNWTHYMQQVFVYFHSLGITKNQYVECLQQIQLAPGMWELLTCLPQASTELIIISDANTFFIDTILQHLELSNVFKTVFTNPGTFDQTGCLRLVEFHNQDWCLHSSPNLCKGSILSDYIEARQKAGIYFSRIGYVGDGTNDFCPSLTLKEEDLVFPRAGFQLSKHIKEMLSKHGLKVKAQIHVWESGTEILENICQVYDKCSPIRVGGRITDPRCISNHAVGSSR